MISNMNSLFIPCWETEESQSIESRNGESEACVSKNDQGEVCDGTLNISSNENRQKDAAFGNGSSYINDLDVVDIPSSNVVCRAYNGWSDGLDNKTQISNGGSTKTPARKKNVKRMHANLSGTKYAVGMYV